MSDYIRDEIFETIFGVEFCDELERIGEQYSESCWSFGLKTQFAIEGLAAIKGAIVRGELEHKHNEYILAFGVMDIYRIMAARFGIKQRTLRDYHAIATFYSDEQRERFAVLPFSHFRKAKQCGKRLAEQVLKMSVKQMDRNGGKPPSVDWLDANLYRVTGDPQVLPDIEAVQDFDYSAAVLPAADFAANHDEPLPQSVYYFMHSIKRLISSLRDRLDRLDITDERKGKISGIIIMIIALADELQVDTEIEK